MCVSICVIIIDTFLRYLSLLINIENAEGDYYLGRRHFFTRVVQSLFFFFFLNLVSGTAGHNAEYSIYLLILIIEIWFTGCDNKYDVNIYIMEINEIRMIYNGGSE